MTIKMIVAPTFAFPVQNAIAAIDALLFDMTVTSATTSLITLSGSGFSATISGSSFGYSQISGDIYLTSGTIEDIDVDQGGVDALDFLDLGMDAATLFAAMVKEIQGTDTSAIETMFFNQKWVIKGNGEADSLLKTTVTQDGIQVNLRGNDKVFTRGGHDKFFSGDGNDRVDGGSGNDVLWGGNGRDKLIGGKGRDKLLGEGGNDTLLGGAGKDLLNGGQGSDTLNGGSSNDRLKGGGGADKFVFAGNNDGNDRILDFQDGIDTIGLSTQNSQTLTIQQSGSNTLVTHAGGTIVLNNIDATDVTSADFFVL